MEIIHKKISELIEYKNNPRVNDHAVERTANAIREFGFRVPILIKSDGSVVDGHLRIKAARKLSMDEVPCLLCDDMSDAQIKAFRISVNKISDLADWDEELLKIELEELQGIDFDLDLIGFDEDETNDLINQPQKIKEKNEILSPIKYTRILISIPNNSGIDITSIIKMLKNSGAEIDYSGN